MNRRRFLLTSLLAPFAALVARLRPTYSTGWMPGPEPLRPKPLPIPDNRIDVMDLNYWGHGIPLEVIEYQRMMETVGQYLTGFHPMLYGADRAGNHNVTAMAALAESRRYWRGEQFGQ